MAWVISDTTRYNDGTQFGLLGVLHFGSRYVDTVDLAFGVQLVPGGVVYLQVHRIAPSEPSPEVPAAVGHHVLFDGSAKRRLAEMLPYFSEYHSSPAVLDSVLYYWALDPDSGSTVRLLAARHDFVTARTDTAYLFTAVLESDYRFYLRPPRFADRFLVYHGPGQPVLLTEALQPAPRGRQPPN